MTHMHIPDGVLPVWLWVSGFGLMVLILAFCLFRLKGMDIRIKVPLLGALSAAMLVSMSLEILPLAYHINLSVVTGILLGPALAFVAACIANLMLALIGHGGITVMGLNTLLLGAEAVLGHTLFTHVGKRLPLFWRAVVATVIALLFTTGLLIGIVAVSNSDPAAFMDADHEPDVPGGPVSVGRFTVMVLGLGALGWVLEAAITGSVVRFISKVKPELLKHVLHSDSGGKKPQEAP